MALNLLLFLLGLALAALTLRDVFETVIVPGASHASLRIAHRLVVVLLPAWKWIRGRRRALSGTFAPVVLVGSFVIWMGLLAIGFGLMALGVRWSFRPAIDGFGEAIYVVGSALVTIGVGETHPFGIGRAIVLGAGFCGLAVMTMAVTYLLEVQTSIARRDTGIMKLNTSAGEPPSALTLLERFAAIRNQSELPDVLREGRDWCAIVRQSHAAHPSLVYFRTDRTGAGWPAALGALLDLALIVELCLDEEDLYGPAVLLGDDGTRMARDLAYVIGLEPKDEVTSEAELDQLAKRLAHCGYRMRPRVDLAAMASRRARYQSCVDALADHLGKPTAVLLRRELAAA